ncbi:hypothetical protein FISHEDRAFT_75575 [Fistulina hepatica ATCC 64428]|uniref:Uncharacterized protein n=1 Tax=Fistulina hepatica ATCC 64428 TaxID=1128425 RepID=A0A0D7A6Q0_9AGAR|nr:hypothetical protein FISHEDRAFT_75575 [Fistulina hepatica ATCC 64428]
MRSSHDPQIGDWRSPVIDIYLSLDSSSRYQIAYTNMHRNHHTNGTHPGAHPETVTRHRISEPVARPFLRDLCAFLQIPLPDIEQYWQEHLRFDYNTHAANTGWGTSGWGEPPVQHIDDVLIFIRREDHRAMTEGRPNRFETLYDELCDREYTLSPKGMVITRNGHTIRVLGHEDVRELFDDLHI